MAKPTSSRIVALATLAAIAVALATPALARTYDHNRADPIYVPVDSGCTGHRAWCDLAQY